MVDSYEVSKALIEKSDEREKAGEKKEAGEKRAELLESSSIPGENKKEIAPTDGKLEEKKNPAGSPSGATKGQGDERDKAGDVKEGGEQRAKLTKAEEDEVEKCNEMAAKKKKVAEIVKAYQAEEITPRNFFVYLKKADPELAKALPVTPELWKDYMVNHSKNVNKGNPMWDETPQELLDKAYVSRKQ